MTFTISKFIASVTYIMANTTVDLSQYSLTSDLLTSDPVNLLTSSSPLVSNDPLGTSKSVPVLSNDIDLSGFTLDTTAAKQKMKNISGDITDFTNTKTTIGNRETTYGHVMLYSLLIIVVIVVVGLSIWGIVTLIKNSVSEPEDKATYSDNATTTTCTNGVCTVTSCNNGVCNSTTGVSNLGNNTDNSSARSDSSKRTIMTNNTSSNITNSNQTKETFNNMIYVSDD